MVKVGVKQSTKSVMLPTQLDTGLCVCSESLHDLLLSGFWPCHTLSLPVTERQSFLSKHQGTR